MPTSKDFLEELVTRFKSARAARYQFDDLWQEVAEIFAPRSADFTETPVFGENRTEDIFDGTPQQASRMLAAALDGLIKPKHQNWFFVRARERRLNEIGSVRAWLEHVEQTMRAAIYNPAARWVQATASVDRSLVNFGTGLMWIKRNPATGLRFQPMRLKDNYIDENADGDVDTLYSTVRFTPRQAVQEFGEDNLSDEIRERAKQVDTKDKPHDFLRVVLPRDDYDSRRADNLNMPWADVFLDPSNPEKAIRESGHLTRPYIAPRWDTETGEKYGRSPAMIGLGDALTLNQQQYTILKAGQKIVDPPLMAPNDSAISVPRAFPGGITYYDITMLAHTRGRPPVFPLQTGANIPIGREMQADIRDQLWQAFFRNVLQLPVGGPEMTATEVLQRAEEFRRVIGPTFGALEADYVAPAIERIFVLMLFGGDFLPPPEELEGQDLDFTFISPIARIQETIEVAALSKSINDLAPLVQVDPTMLDHLNRDQIARDVPMANGVPMRWLNLEEQVAQIRQQRAEAQQAAAQAQEAAAAVQLANAAG